MSDSEETQQFLQRIRDGDRRALDELLARHRRLLRDFVHNRLDRKIQARVDASDVIQMAQLEVAKRIDDFLERQPMPFHLWIRKTAYENLLRLRRQHAQAGCRDVQREAVVSDDSSMALARQLMADTSTPSQRLVKEEMARRMREALALLPEVDQEILLLRTHEGLGNDETAQVLGLEPNTASKRYGRALLRLRAALAADGPLESQR